MKKIVTLAVSFVLLFGLLVCFTGCGKVCDRCNGSGESSMPRLDPKYGKTGEVMYVKCYLCNGTGRR